MGEENGGKGEDGEIKGRRNKAGEGRGGEWNGGREGQRRDSDMPSPLTHSLP